MSEYNRHRWAMEWMYGGGRDPHGRSLDEEIKLGKEEWTERQRVAQGGRIGLQSGQLVQPGPGRQGYGGDDELGRGLTEFVDPKNDKIYYRFEVKFSDGSYYRKRLPKNPENLKIMKGIQKKQHKLLQKSYGGKILYPTELIEFVDNNPDLTHQQVADHFKKRVGPYGKKINRENVISTLDRYDELESFRGQGGGRTADELYEVSGRLNAGKHYIAEYEKTGDISRFRHQVKTAVANMNQQEKKMFKIGKFNAGTLPDQVLFNDLYRSSTGKDPRWKLITEPPRDKSGKIKWTRETARNAEFIDTKNPKRKPITFKNLKGYMDEFLPSGAYDDAIKSIELNTFLKEQMVKYRGKETKLGGLLNQRIFSPDDWDDYMFGRSAFQRHHPGNIKDNWWKSENVFVDANQELNKIQQTFEANMKHLKGDARVKEMERFGNEVDNIIKKSGPISVETPHGTFGRAADTEGVLEAIKKAAYSRSGDKALSRTINKAKKDFLKLAPKKSTTKIIPANFAAQFDDAIKSGKFKKFKKVGNLLGGEVAFAVLDYINSRTKGQSHEKAKGKALETASFDIADLDADEKAIIKHAIAQGASEEEVGALRNYLNYMKKYKTYERANKMLDYAKKNLGEGTGSYEDIGTTWDDVTDAAQNLKLRENELRDLQATYEEGFEGEPDMMLGKQMLTKYIDSLAAEEWNKTAGTILDRGSRTHQGEGVVWNPIGALTRDIGGLFSGEMPTEFWDATFGKVPSLLDPRIKEKEKQIRLMERPVVGTDYPEYDLAREDMKYDFDYALDENYAEGGIVDLLKK